jgi:hypothetical protein
LWSDITPIARRDWIHWITSAKQAETRARRIKNAYSMRCTLASSHSNEGASSASAVGSQNLTDTP